MKIICSYCRRPCGEKEPLEDDRTTHGMCDDCFDHFERQAQGLKLDEYLDEFEKPILIVNKEGRIAALNKNAAARLGRPQKKIVGLLGGEAIECNFSRLPEGCGKTVHCETCTLRQTIIETLTTGKTLQNVRKTVRKNDREIDMVFSSYYVDGMVKIVIDG
jgi:transcriptional regulator with PAS, ATPase and Fis domain